MKTNLHLLLLISQLLIPATFAQTPQKITLNLKNNGLIPREFKFLECAPDGKYPNVFTAFILPGQSYKVALKIGTLLSRVNQQEINATMRGQPAPGKLLLTVKAEDDGRTVKLVQK